LAFRILICTFESSFTIIRTESRYNHSMTLSVIIPVYKTEKTLNRCIKNILSQQITDMEVILVDDGSPDECPQICDDWAAKDHRICVIHQQNSGLSAARNAGIEKAQGDYITFVDSDDYLDENTLSYLLNVCREHPEYDILEYPAILHEGAPKQETLNFTDNAYTSVKEYWDQTCAYTHTYACNKIYKRTLFREIKFPKGMVFEDTYTTPLLLQASTIVATSSKGLYHYCFNKQGITSTASKEEWRMLLDAHLRICNSPLFNPPTEDYILNLLNIQLYTNELTGDKPLIPKLNFQDNRSLKVILYRLLGINNLCKLNRLFRKIVKRRT